MKGWLIRAQQPRSKRISCKGQVGPAVRKGEGRVRGESAQGELSGESRIWTRRRGGSGGVNP